jgi:hypothetical protein
MECETPNVKNEPEEEKQVYQNAVTITFGCSLD